MIDAVQFALSYPFAIPERSYLFEDGSVAARPPTPADRHGRTALLAVGSNQSPAQLARKYAGVSGAASRIPAERAMLRDFDVVYAAHLARYGSLPAALQSSPGTRIAIFVLWLGPAQLARMHETEASYSFDRLDGLDLILDGGDRLAEACCYAPRAGCANFGGRCAALAEIAAEGRRFPAPDQRAAQARLRDRLAPGCAVEAFVAAHIADSTLRRARALALAADALPLAYPRTTIDPLCR